MVPRLDWSDPRASACLVRGEPVVLSGGCPLSAGIAHWNVAHLAATLAEEPAAVARATWPVHYTPAGQPRVSRAYGRGVGEGGVCSMSMSDFEARLRLCESCSTGTQPHLYLQAVLASRNAPRHSMPETTPETTAEIAPETTPEITPEITPSRPLGAALGRDLEERIGWAWLRATCEAAGGLGGDHEAFEACQLWASRGRLYTPCHFDGAHNFFCQLEGSKRFLLFAPSQGYRLYPYPVGHPMDNFAMASLEQPDLARFPLLAQAEGHVALVQPGDVLFLPKFWWHHVEAPATAPSPAPATAPATAAHDGLPPRTQNLSLNFWLGPASRRTQEHYEWLSTRASSRRVVQYFVGGPEGAQRVREELHAMGLAVGPETPREQQEDSARDGATIEGSARDDAEKEQQEEALGALMSTSSGAILCLHAARMAEQGATAVCGGSRAGGRFLNAVAAAEDAAWGLEGRHAVCALAAKLRDEVAAVVGSDAAARALLRQCTRDGRLYPGLAPPIEGPIVRSEHGETTPEDEVEAALGGAWR